MLGCSLFLSEKVLAEPARGGGGEGGREKERAQRNGQQNNFSTPT